MCVPLSKMLPVTHHFFLFKHMNSACCVNHHRPKLYLLVYDKHFCPFYSIFSLEMSSFDYSTVTYLTFET